MRSGCLKRESGKVKADGWPYAEHGHGAVPVKFCQPATVVPLSQIRHTGFLGM